MKLVLEPLLTQHQQEFTANKRLVLDSVRLHLYKHLSPAGTIIAEIEQGGVVVGTSTLDSATIEANSEATNTNYFHGMVRFQLDSKTIVNEGNFIVRLKAGTYTHSPAAYFGWVKPHDNKYITEDYTASDDKFNSFGLELWEYR